MLFEGGQFVNTAKPNRAADFNPRYRFKGHARIWLKRSSADVVNWFYSWTLKRLDRACARNHRIKACTKRYVVR